MRLSAQLSLVFLIWLGALGCDDDGTPCFNSVNVAIYLPDRSILRGYEGEYTNNYGTHGLFCDANQSQPQNGRTSCQLDGLFTLLADTAGTDPNKLGFRLKIRSLDGQWAFDGEVPGSEVQDITSFGSCITGKASVTVSAVTP
jgi:hypothetical protein